MGRLALLVAATLAAPSTAAAASPEARLPVFEQGTGVVLAERPSHVDARRNVRPGSISGLDGWSVRWRRWGGRRATGRARYYWNSPDGSDVRTYPSRLSLERRRTCGRFMVYTRIRGTFTGETPPGMRRTVKLKAYPYPCPASRRAVAARAARRCGTIAFAPASEDGVFSIRARGTSCRTARKVARKVRPLSITRGPYRYRAFGYRCRGRLREDGLHRVRWRCTKRAARITFTRA